MPKNTEKSGADHMRVSQNFLTSSRIIKNLITRAGLTKNDTVIEIGAGKGHITCALVTVCRFVTAYEIDSGLCGKLLIKCADAENLSVKNQDFLTARLPRSAYKIFANIPFNITTKIMEKLITSPNPPEEAWLVMEKGAAIRFCGRKKESLYSLFLKPIYDMEITYYFKRDDFHPAPSVDVVMLHLKRKPHTDIPSNQLNAYRNFITSCYKHDALKRFFTKKQMSRLITGIYEHGSLPAPGEILYIQWICLFRWYCGNGLTSR